MISTRIVALSLGLLVGACASEQPDLGRVAVHLGNGDGTFGEGMDVAVALPPRSLALGDLDLDGHLDLATVGYGEHGPRLSLLRGRGDGSFEPARKIPVQSPRAVVIADLNADGLPDIAMAGDKLVEVCLAVSAGELGTCAPYPGAQTASIVAADLNGDGITDLAVAGYLEQLVRILPGRGDGTFGAPIEIPTGQGPYSLTAGDLDADGRLDLVTANMRVFWGVGDDSQYVSVLLATEDGGFAPHVDYVAGLFPAFVAVVNVDESHDDLVVSTLQGGVHVLGGNGDGTFAAATQHTPSGSRPWAMAVDDFDRDGTKDVAVTSYAKHRVDILLGTGDGPLDPAGQGLDVENAFAIQSGDLNGDGIPDLVIGDGGPYADAF